MKPQPVSRMVPLAVCLIALVAACGRNEGGTVEAGTREVSSTTAATDAEEFTTPAVFASAVAQSPYYLSSDYSAPSDASEWGKGAGGLIQGELLSLEAGPTEGFTLGSGENVVTLPRVNLSITIKVTALSSAAAISTKVGDVVTAIVPIWQGPPESAKDAVHDYVDPLIAIAPPAGSGVLVCVEAINQGVIDVYGVAGIILQTPDGSAASLISIPSPDGTVFGLRSLTDIMRTAVG